MRTAKQLLITVAVLLCSTVASAHDFEVGGIYYNIISSSDLTVEVTYKGTYSDSYTEYSGAVVIPQTVTYYSKTYSVTTIEYSAFSGCRGLTSIEIPSSVTTLVNLAFEDCTGLTSVTIPNSVTSIGSYAFSGCTGLASISVEKGNAVYDSRENCNAIIETQTNTLISGCKNTIIPNSVTTIGEYAFSECTGLTSVTIPNSVTTIGNDAFEDCSGLTSITIGNSVTTIGLGAFEDCTRLTSVTIPNSVTTIGLGAFLNTAWYNNQPDGLVYAGKVLYKYKGTMPQNTSIVIEDGTLGITSSAFEYCARLTSVTIPNSVTTIGSGAFLNCTGLTSITIPGSVTTIGGGAFGECTGLTSVTIPNSVTTIGDRAFSGCDGLTSVTIGNSVTTIGNSAFYKCTGLTSVTIPNSVTTIGSGAFSGCDGLTSVTIPNSVTTIASGAFRDCTNLKEIYSLSETPPVFYSINTFSDYSATLYVPIGAKETYQTTDYWKEFANIVEMDFTGITEISPDATDGFGNGVIYDLNGRPVNEPAKGGIYIIGGKKVVL